MGAAEFAFLIKRRAFLAGGGKAATGCDAGLVNVAADEQKGTDTRFSKDWSAVW